MYENVTINTCEGDNKEWFIEERKALWKFERDLEM